MTDADDSCRALLDRYHKSVRISHTAYDLAASGYCKKGRFYGIVAASFSAVVATAAFASLSADTVPAWLKLLAGLFGTTAAVVAGMEATLKYPEMAINYRAAANKYEKVLHQAELLELEPTVHEADVRKIATAWEAVAAEVPIISDRQYARAEKHVDVAERKQADEAHQAASLKAA